MQTRIKLFAIVVLAGAALGAPALVMLARRAPEQPPAEEAPPAEPPPLVQAAGPRSSSPFQDRSARVFALRKVRPGADAGADADLAGPRPDPRAPGAGPP